MAKRAKKITRRSFEQLYNINRAALIEKLTEANPMLKKRNVKRLVKEMFDSYRKVSKSNEEAFNKLMHREEFVSRAVRGAENLVKGLKEQGAFKDFRKEVIGWKKKLNLEDIKWDETKGMYTYNGWNIYQATTSLGSPEWRWVK